MQQTRSTDIILDFPKPSIPVGATPALVGPPEDDGPFFFRNAEGPYTVSATEMVALKFPNHTSGQMAALADGTPGLAGRLAHLEIDKGNVGESDLNAIGELRTRRVVLGEGRNEKGFGEPLELSVDTFSGLGGVDTLEAYAVPVTDRHLATLASPMSLRILFLDSIPVSPGTLGRFGSLRGLSVAGTDGIGDDLGFLSHMRSLELLGIRFSDLTVDRLASIATHPWIEILDIAYNPNVGPDLGPLPSENLTFLDVSTTAVDDSSLVSLDGWRLTQLVAQCTGITDAGLGHLPSSLTKLNLATTDISDEGLERIVTTSPQLTELDVRSVAGITKDGLRRWLPELIDLLVLGVSGALLDADLAEELNATTGLEHLIISGPLDNDDESWIEAVDIIGSAKFTGTPR